MQVVVEFAEVAVNVATALSDLSELRQFATKDQTLAMPRGCQAEQQISLAATSSPTIVEMVGGAVIRLSLWTR